MANQRLRLPWTTSTIQLARSESSEKRHVSQSNYRQIFDTVIIASNLGILRSVEFGAAKLLLVWQLPILTLKLPATTTRGRLPRCYEVLRMMNVGGSMHPTKYAVRCIVHSTVLMSDISCVWGFGAGYLIGYCAAQFLTRPPTLGDSHFLITQIWLRTENETNLRVSRVLELIMCEMRNSLWDTVTALHVFESSSIRRGLYELSNVRWSTHPLKQIRCVIV